MSAWFVAQYCTVILFVALRTYRKLISADGIDTLNALAEEHAKKSQIHRILRQAMAIVADNIHFLSWIAYFVASTTYFSLIAAVYLFLFLLDFRGAAGLVFSAIHLFALYVYPFAFFPSYGPDEWMRYTGLSKALFTDPARDIVNILFGPGLVFVSCLIYQNVFGTSTSTASDDGGSSDSSDVTDDSDADPLIVVADRKEDEKEVEREEQMDDKALVVDAPDDQVQSNEPVATDSSKNMKKKASFATAAKRGLQTIWWFISDLAIYIYDDFYYDCGIEVLQLWLLISMHLLELRMATLFYFGLFALTVLKPRHMILTHDKLIPACSIFFSLLYLLTQWFAVGTPYPDSIPGMGSFFEEEVTLREEKGVEKYRYDYANWVGGHPDVKLLGTFFGTVVFLRLLSQSLPRHRAEVPVVLTLEDDTEVKTTADILQHYLIRIARTRKDLNPIDFIVPKGGGIIQEDSYRHPTRAYEYLINLFGVLFLSPILVFADGVTATSFIHFAAVGFGASMFRTRSRVFWTYFKPWPKAIRFSLVVLGLTALCHVPSLAEVIENQTAFWRAIGLTSLDGERTMELSALRVAAIWLLLLQLRHFDSMYFVHQLVDIQRHTIDSQLQHFLLHQREGKKARAAEASAAKKKAERDETMERLKAERAARLQLAPTVVTSSTAGSPADPTAPPEQKPPPAPEPPAIVSQDDDGLTAEEEGDAQTNTKQSKSEQAGPSISERVAQAADSFVNAALAHTFHLEPPSPAIHWSLRVLIVLIWVLLRHTKQICFFIYSMNFALSGNLFDGVLSASNWVYASLWSPWPDRTYWTLCMLYTATGMLIKAAVWLIAEQGGLGGGVINLLSALLINLGSEGNENTTPREILVRNDLTWSFCVIVIVQIHLAINDFYGVYFEEARRELKQILQELEEEKAQEDEESEGSSVDSTFAAYESESPDGSQISSVASTEVGFFAAHDKTLTDGSPEQKKQRREELELSLREAEGGQGEASATETKEIQLVVNEEESEPVAATTESVVGTTGEVKTVVEEENNEEEDEEAMWNQAQEMAAYVKRYRFLTDPEASIPQKVKRNVRYLNAQGIDLYFPTFLLEMFSLFYSLFNYFALAGGKSSFSEALSNNLLPGNMVIMLIIEVFVIIADRIIYIRAMSTRKKAAMFKFGLHCALTAFYTLFYVFWMNSIASKVTPGAVLLLLKHLYLLLSGLQIYHGYPMFRRHDPFTWTNQRPVTYFYLIYRAIPILWDARITLDWTFTNTALNFKEYLKVEDLHHNVFTRYRLGGLDTIIRPKLGQRLPQLDRFTEDGFLFFFLLLVLLFFPLGFYSNFNPSLGDNPVVSISMSAKMSIYGEVYSSTSFYVQDVLQEQIVLSGLEKTNSKLTDLGYLGEKNRLFQYLPLEQCSASTWQLSPTSNDAFLYHLGTLSGRIETNLDVPDFVVTVETTVVRKAGGAGSDPESSFSEEIKLSSSEAGRLYDDANELLNSTLVNASNAANGGISAGGGGEAKAELPKFLYPYIVNLPTKAVEYTEAGDLSAKCALVLKSEFSALTQSLQNYWCIECQGLFYSGNIPNITDPDAACSVSGANCNVLGHTSTLGGATLHADRPANATAPYFVITSDQIPTGSTFLPVDIGIIAFYTTFLLAAGRIIRGSLTGMSHKIVLGDIKNPKCIAELISYIYMSRGIQEKSEEEEEEDEEDPPENEKDSVDDDDGNDPPGVKHKKRDNNEGGGADDDDDDTSAIPLGERELTPLEVEHMIYLELIDMMRAPDTLVRRSGLRTQSYDPHTGKKIAGKPYLKW